MRPTWLVLLAFGLAVHAGCSPGVGGPYGDPTGPKPDVGSKPGGHETTAGSVDRVREALRRGDLGAAREALARVDTSAGDPRDRERLEELRKVIGFLAGEHDEDLEALRLAHRHLDLGMVRAFRKLDASTYPGQYIRARLALYEAHRWRRAEPAQKAQPGVSDPVVRKALERVAGRWDALDVTRPKTIGVLLPLTGPFAKIGEAALRSIQLAVGRKSGIRLVVKDTRASGPTAARQVESLVAKHGVVGILGPVGAFETTEAVRRASELGVPIVVLSSREGVAGEGKWAFRTRVIPSRQGIRLARHAVGDMGIKRFGLLISDSPYGWALAGAFWDEVVRLGGAVVSAVTYERGTASYKALVGQLAGGARKQKKLAAGFEGLLIADDHGAVRKLIPYFPYWGLRIRRMPKRPGVQLLGGDGWNHHSIVDEAERLTENAIFCDAFFPDEEDARVNAFVTRFFEKYREPPSPFEAEVYDAARLLGNLVARSDSDTRAGLAGNLIALKAYRGVTGVVRFDESGDAIKDVVLLTVDQDRVRLRASEREERAIRKGAGQ